MTYEAPDFEQPAESGGLLWCGDGQAQQDKVAARVIPDFCESGIQRLCVESGTGDCGQQVFIAAGLHRGTVLQQTAFTDGLGRGLTAGAGQTHEDGEAGTSKGQPSLRTRAPQSQSLIHI